ncbi:MAG: tRNA (adenosine(37)-N6)-dimethylallyltransferase MiaA [Deltaproteobacteria bacterium]|nr:tRNA (adenosine(37)-N6)-dimethylallyltransferase MiaA [Deltaproteobacteria bacterium]
MDATPIVLVGGPTGVGKSALAIELARRLGGEILNADSLQVYRYMDIGTAKPSDAERRLVPHHLLDLVRPDEPFDAALFGEAARPVIEALRAEGRVPIVTGGTGLYMKTLLGGICPGAPSSGPVREELLKELEDHGLEFLHRSLKSVDPLLGQKIHPHDRQRVLRALEVFRLTGKPLSHWQERHRFRGGHYPAVKIGLGRDRAELCERIDRRVFTMMEQGFLEEVENLLSMGFGPELKPMRSLGYRQLVRYLSGDCSMEAALGEIQRDTRRYAKRQMTWFRGDAEFQWFHPAEQERIIAWVRERLRAFPDS